MTAFASGYEMQEYDFFVSYARSDDMQGFVRQFVERLTEEHRAFSGGRELTYFLDVERIPNFASWETEIFQKHLRRSRLFLAFLSPAYFASEICRREWQAWVDREISLHVLGDGAAPIYFVEIPGLYSKPALSERDVAFRVAELSGRDPRSPFVDSVTPVVREVRRRQTVSRVVDNSVRPFQEEGLFDLRREDLRGTLRRLAQDLERRSQDVANAAKSENEVPPYNPRFTGRIDELLELRRRLSDDGAGVIASLHGLGGIGKTELAFTYAHAFAGVYPGGRFYLRCEGLATPREAILQLGQYAAFRSLIGDEERKSFASYVNAILRILKTRLAELGHVLLVLDNVSDSEFLSQERTDELTVLGPKLHLLATTRLPRTSHRPTWLALGELKRDEALALLERYRPFADDAERQAAKTVVERLGGFALAIELVAARLATKRSATYAGAANQIGLEKLRTYAEDRNVESRRHNHEKRLEAVLGPTLEQLTPVGRAILDYAALLHPDHVALPWIRDLVTELYPALSEPGADGEDLWDEEVRTLAGWGLLSGIGDDANVPNAVRLHRLIAALVRKASSGEEIAMRQEAIHRSLTTRNEGFERRSDGFGVRWETEAMEALAWLWDEERVRDPAWLMNEVGQRWQLTAEWTRAERLMRRSLELDLEHYGPEHRRTALRCNNLGTLLAGTDRFPEAEALLRRGLAIRERALPPDDPLIANSMHNLASLLRATDQVAEAEFLLRQVVDRCERSDIVDPFPLGAALNALAVILAESGRLDEAESVWPRCLEAMVASLGPRHPHYALALVNYADTLRQTERIDEWERCLDEALPVLVDTLGPEHPSVAGACDSIALLFSRRRRFVDAEFFATRSIEINERTFGPESPNVGDGYGRLAGILLRSDRIPEADAAVRRALAINERALGPLHSRVVRLVLDLAESLRRQAKYAEAERTFLDALERELAARGPLSSTTARIMNDFVTMLSELGRLEDVSEHCRRWVELAVPAIADEVGLGRAKHAIAFYDQAMTLTGVDPARRRENLIASGVPAEWFANS